MEKSRSLKKAKKSLILTLVLTMVMILLVGCKSMGKYEDAYENYEQQFAQVYFSDKNQSAYDLLMYNLKKNIEDKKASKCDKNIESLEALLEASKSYSLSYLDKLDKNIISKSEGLDLYQDEVNKIEEYKSEIETDKADERYRDAGDVYSKYEAFLDAISMSENYSLEVSQVDVSEYPNVKIYASIKDARSGESIDSLKYENFYLSEDMEASGFEQIKLEKAVQLDQAENVNIDIVADISASMDVCVGSNYDTNMEISKRAMVSFVNQMQFDVGDKAGLVSFSDGVTRELYFTDDKSSLINRINSLPMGNMTSLYDALYASINQIVSENGAKCIVAFTDGQDNVSRVSYEAVKDLAQRYKIPIYIIGIGSSLNGGILQDIAESTGGFYRNISDASYMAGVYDSIFEEQKSQYLLEYTTTSDKEEVERNIYIRYISQQIATRTTYSYIPKYWIDANTGSAVYNENGYIFPESDRVYLSIADLENLSDKELRLARNEIYARRGRKFKDSELQKYFNGCSWYDGYIAPDDFNDDRMLNKYERANAYLILDYEKSRK